MSTITYKLTRDNPMLCDSMFPKVRRLVKILVCLIILEAIFACFHLYFWKFKANFINQNSLPVLKDRENQEDTEYADCVNLPLFVEANNSDKIVIKSRIPCRENSENFVTIENGKVVLLTDEVTNCSYRVIISRDNYTVHLSSKNVNFKSGDSIPNDYFRITCYRKNNEEYSLPLLGIKPLNNVAEERSKIIPSSDAMNYNIVLLRFDSMSRKSVRENLPNVYEYFTQNMMGTVLMKHSAGADGSDLNILAMSTGLNLSQLLKGRDKNSTRMDSFPLIFHDLKEAGYITLFSEGDLQREAVDEGGFEKNPFDHYTRPFFLHEPMNSGCLGGIKRHNVLFNLLNEFFSVYESKVKKFALIHQVESSFDNNTRAENIEDDLLNLLKDFRPGGKFDKTILFFYSDHGARYDEIDRASMRGKYEERLPMLGVYLPPELRRNRPDIVTNLNSNVNMLTTQFDVHATLLHILGQRDERNTQSISLFDEIPNRSCETLGLTPRWCFCGKRTRIPSTDSMAHITAMAVVDKINILTRKSRRFCASLRLGPVMFAELREYVSSNRSAELIYQIIFSTTPGDGEFKSLIFWNIQTQEFIVPEEEIIRMNSFAPWVKCLQDKYPKMRKFCICKDAIPKSSFDVFY